MNNILVTGHRGYLGPLLIKELKEKGYQTTGIDLDFFHVNFPIEYRPHIELKKDIRVLQAKQLEGFDAIIHLAALSDDHVGNISKKNTFEINLNATVRLATLAKKEGVKRFIFSSTCSVYGKIKQDEIILNENSPTNPQSFYAESKLRSEEELIKLQDERFKAVILRNGTAFGLAPNMRFDLVLNNLVLSAYKKGRILITSDGSPLRPMVHVKDIVSGLIWALQLPEIEDRPVYNIALENGNFKVSELAKKVQSAFPECELIFLNKTPHDNRSYAVSSDKAKNIPSPFIAFTSVEYGIKEIHHWLVKNTDVEVNELTTFFRSHYLKSLIDQNKLSHSLAWRL